MPTFWGPRAPDQVLAEGNYLRAAAVSGAGTAGERQMLKHLMHRVDWLRDIRGKWVSPSLTLAYGSAGNHGFSSDRAIVGGVDGDRLLGKAVEEEPAHL